MKANAPEKIFISYEIDKDGYIYPDYMWHRHQFECLFGGVPHKDYIYKPYTDIPYHMFGEVITWLNAHHFDYRGLIEKGLAIAVTEEDNPYEN